MIGLVLAGSVVLRFFEPIFVRIYFEKPLMTASTAVVNSFSEYHHDRGNLLSAFLPPANPDTMIVWAKKLEERLGQPAAIFVREGKAMTWIDVPQELQAAINLVPKLFDPGLSEAQRRKMDTLGSFEHRYAHVETDTMGYTVWIVGLVGDTLRWGAVVQPEDAWRPFLADLKTGASAPLLSRASVELNTHLQIEYALQKMTSRTGMRAFLQD